MRRSILIALTALLALVLAVPMVSAQSDVGSNNGVPPEDATATYTPEQIAANPGHCDFPMKLEISGKTKQIKLPDGGLIVSSPGQFATITNVANGEHATFNITGTSHQSTLANGDVKTVITGRNFAIDPVVGTVITIGHYSFVFDAAGNLVQSQEGTGNRIDLCELLS